MFYTSVDLLLDSKKARCFGSKKTVGKCVWIQDVNFRSEKLASSIPYFIVVHCSCMVLLDYFIILELHSSLYPCVI